MSSPSKPVRILLTVASVLVLGIPLYRFLLPPSIIDHLKSIIPALLLVFAIGIGTLHFHNKVTIRKNATGSSRASDSTILFLFLAGIILAVLGATGVFYSKELVPIGAGTSAAATLAGLSIVLAIMGVAVLIYGSLVLLSRLRNQM